MENSLEQLSLSIKQSLQFLNALSLNIQYQSVFKAGQRLKVDRPIIALDSVEVMHVPSFGQDFIIRLFPDDNVFKDIVLPTRPMMPRSVNCNITIVPRAPTSLPPITIASHLALQMARLTQFAPARHKVITIRARDSFALPILTTRLSNFKSIAKVRVSLYRFSAQFFYFHKLIIPQTPLKCKLQRYYGSSE